MNKKQANALSKAIIVIRDCYLAKANNAPYKKLELAAAKQYIEDTLLYLERKAGDAEREFLFTCLAVLDALAEDENAMKTARYADAISRVPFLFCGEESWDGDFRRKHIVPFCQIYGEAYFSDILKMKLPIDRKTDKRSSYRYGEDNILSLPKYFCFRMSIALITLPFIIGAMIWVECDDYTEEDYGKRYEVTVADYAYDETLELYCQGYEAPFEVARFSQYSVFPDRLIQLCESGATLVAYAEFKEDSKYGDRYEVIQLEDLDGTVYRTYEHSNQLDIYNMYILWLFFAVVFVPHFVLLIMMISVVLWPGKYLSYPRFVKFCFPDYSLPYPRESKTK